jgi:hypothetical protein
LKNDLLIIIKNMTMKILFLSLNLFFYSLALKAQVILYQCKCTNEWEYLRSVTYLKPSSTSIKCGDTLKIQRNVTMYIEGRMKDGKNDPNCKVKYTAQGMTPNEDPIYIILYNDPRHPHIDKVTLECKFNRGNFWRVVISPDYSNLIKCQECPIYFKVY